jgi:hypothetical protein
MQFKAPRCKFFGNILTKDGMEVDSEKVDAIKKMAPPSTKAELQSFLGIVNYMKTYTATLTDASAPLRQLCKEGIVYQWEKRHQDAFENIKDELTRTPVLAYFDAKKNHVIQTDASEKGLGGVLLQDDQPVMYISRALTPTEKGYSNIERELLSLVFGMERLHNFVYGGTTLVQTDHKPLESIFKKTVSETTPRLQRLMLRLHRYDIDVQYLKGQQNVIAEALSRVSPLPPSQEDMDHLDLVSIHYLQEIQPIGVNALQELREATAADPALQQLKVYVMQGWPDRVQNCDARLKTYWTYKESISCEAGLLYKGARVIVPERKVQQILAELHTAHQGEEKTLSLARENVFWSGMKTDICTLIKTCEICQKFRPCQQKELLMPHDVPAGPWEKLGMDIFELKGVHYLLIADYFSKFPVVRS